MSTQITDEQIHELAASAKPYSVVLLWWGPKRHMEGAEAIERAHQRRILSLRADGVIAVLCPSAGSDTLAGIAIMNRTPEEATHIMTGDPCVEAEMIRYEVQPCVGFPGDSLPA